MTRWPSPLTQPGALDTPWVGHDNGPDARASPPERFRPFFLRDFEEIEMSNYRVFVHYDPERSVFVARAPELEHCSGEGPTRGEAIARVEEEIDAQVRNMREQGAPLPVAIDDGGDVSGEITARVTKSLHRELLFQARAEGVELPQLVGEMLAAALDARRARAGGQRRQPATQGAEGDPPQPRRDDRGPPQRQYGGGRPNDRGGGGRYHAIMEDRATFLEYVRGLESGQAGRAPQGGGGRRRGPRRPDGSGGGSGDDGEGQK
jgi:antitoxin HicB